MAGQLFRYRLLREAGISRRRIDRVIDGGSVFHLSRGIYGDGPGGRVQEVRSLLARMPVGTVVGYQTAAEIYGFGPACDQLHVVLPVGAVKPRIRGVVCHETVVPVESALMVAGLPCALPARCAVDLARTSTRMDGLALLDAALRVGASTTADLDEELVLHTGLRGVCQARELVSIADGRAECPQESHLRLVIIDGGLPAPEPQIWVHDPADRPVYRIDLGYRETQVGLEYDGRSHLTTARLNADRSRMNWLSAQGWTMRYFTAKDVYRSPATLVATVRAALAG